MARPGLSLLGFMDEPFARAYLEQACQGAGSTPAALSATWQAARNKLGAPAANAGHPGIQALPGTVRPHLRRVQNLNPRFRDTIKNAGGWDFKSVEIDPLLSFQFHIDTDGAARSCAGVKSDPPTLGEMLQTCLPTAPAKLTHQVAPSTSGFFIRSNDLNVRLLDVRAGPTGGDTWTAQFVWGPSTPLVSVVHYGGRYYLNNGYHRAYGLRAAGATHMPCIVLEVNSWTDFVNPSHVVFSETLLTSADPPTVAHFTQGRATAVALRNVTRFIQISLSELALPDQDP